MNRAVSLILTLMAFMLIPISSAHSQPRCEVVFNTQPQSLQGDEFTNSLGFIDSKAEALVDPRFIRFREKYPQMNEVDAVALYHYTGDLAEKLNQVLATEQDIPRYNQAKIYINSALSYLPLVRKNILYRGLKYKEVDDLVKYNVGDEFTLKAYKSTSDALRVAEIYATYRDGYSHMMIVKNAQAYDLVEISRHPTEREFLIKEGSRFKLVDIEFHEERGSKTKKYIVEMLD